MMFRLSAIALLVFFASTFGPSQVGNAVRVTPIEKELSLRFFSLGSLSKNDGDGYERVIYKLNLRCSNGRCLVSTSFKKREPQDVPRRSRAVMAKKCTKRRGARAKFFCQSKPINAFLLFSLPSSSSLLSSLLLPPFYFRAYPRKNYATVETP